MRRNQFCEWTRTCWVRSNTECALSKLFNCCVRILFINRWAVSYFGELFSFIISACYFRVQLIEALNPLKRFQHHSLVNKRMVWYSSLNTLGVLIAVYYVQYKCWKVYNCLVSACTVKTATEVKHLCVSTSKKRHFCRASSFLTVFLFACAVINRDNSAFRTTIIGDTHLTLAVIAFKVEANNSLIFLPLPTYEEKFAEFPFLYSL